MKKVGFILALLAWAVMLAPVHAEPTDAAACQQMSYIVHKIEAGLTYCDLPVPDTTPSVMVEFFARLLEGTCNEGNTSKGAELGESGVPG